jgi:hypothetical protein
MRTLALLSLISVAAISATVSAQPEPGPHDRPVPFAKFFDNDAPVPVSPFQPDLTPGYVLIEGDIQVRLEQYLALMNGLDGTFGGVTYWPNGIVPYDFVVSGTGTVTQANQNAAIAAMAAIAARAGVTFRPATGSDPNLIRFQNSSFNNSPVGRQGGAQIINIVSWGTQIIICHELYHSLGFWHEQSRTDRGSFVTINNANICGTAGSGACSPSVCQMCSDGTNFVSCAFNFNITGNSIAYGFYDFDSFMHYGRTSFSCNGGDTITVVPAYNAAWQNSIGQRDHFSYFDRITCRGLYPFNTDRWLDHNNFGTQGGTFLLPWNLSFVNAVTAMPSGGNLFIKGGGSYSAIGTYSNPCTIDAPDAPVTLGN